MEIKFDTDKDAINGFKHRLPLAFGRRLFDDPAHEVISTYREIDRKSVSRRSAWSMASFTRRYSSLATPQSE